MERIEALEAQALQAAFVMQEILGALRALSNVFAEPRDSSAH
jgi:hypothetical protein